MSISISLNFLLKPIFNYLYIKLIVISLNNKFNHDAASSYHCPSPITGSNIPNLDFVLNCCYGFPRMNASYLESLEQPDYFFLSPFINLNSIFFKISKCLIHSLRKFEYKNTCELYDNILDKDRKFRLMVKKCFILHEEVIDIFHEKYYIPTIQKMSFHIVNVRIFFSM